MRVRYRSSGDGPSLTKHLIEQKNTNAYIDVAWNYNGRPGPINPPLQSQTVDLWGTLVEIPPPPVIQGTRGQTANSSDPTYLASIQQIIESKLSAYSVAEYFWPTAFQHVLESWDDKRMTDVIGDQFRKRQRANERVVHPCTSSSISYKCLPLSSGTDTYSFSVTSMGQNYYYSGIRISFVSSLYPKIALGLDFHDQLLLALEQLYVDSNLESMYADSFSSKDDAEMELLTTLAEGKKTLGYVMQRLSTLASILKQARRGDFSFLGKKANNLDPASLWLEARYAVRPIIIDVENTLRALSKDGNLFKILRTHRHNTYSSEENISFEHTNDAGVSGTVDLNVSYSEYASAGLYSQLQLDWPIGKNFGLTNVTRTFWEVIPWSFVLDWFVNIAGLITLINPNPIYKPLSGWTSLKRTSIFSGTFTCTVNTTEFQIPISGISNTYNRLKKDLPDPIVFDFNLSIPKFIDLISFGSRR